MFYNIVNRATRKFLKKKSDLDRLLQLPRNTPGSSKLLDKTVSYPDAVSYAWTVRELFIHKIYDFKPNTASPYILDCGANIGLSIIFFKSILPDATIVAFEPDPKIFDFLKRNVNAFQFGGVELINKGVWNREGTIEFMSEGSDAGRISNIEKDKSKISVAVTKLSKYIDRKVDFLKIDIEGAENEVMDEIEEKLHLVDRIFLEFHSFDRQEQKLGELLQILKKNKFRYYLTEGAIISKAPFSSRFSFLSMDMQINIFAIKEELL